MASLKLILTFLEENPFPLDISFVAIPIEDEEISLGGFSFVANNLNTVDDLISFSYVDSAGNILSELNLVADALVSLFEKEQNGDNYLAFSYLNFTQAGFPEFYNEVAIIIKKRGESN